MKKQNCLNRILPHSTKSAEDVDGIARTTVRLSKQIHRSQRIKHTTVQYLFQKTGQPLLPVTSETFVTLKGLPSLVRVRGSGLLSKVKEEV